MGQGWWYNQYYFMVMMCIIISWFILSFVYKNKNKQANYKQRCKWCCTIGLFNISVEVKKNKTQKTEITIKVEVPEPGWYVFQTWGSVSESNASLLKGSELVWIEHILKLFKCWITQY